MKTQITNFHRIILLGVLLLLNINLNAQEGDFEPKLPDHIPPSPTAYELGKYGDIPVNAATGIANISIPLYSFNTRDLSVPISLSYATSGIKVHQVSTWVGLGWNLNVGGSITREIRGMPDEDAQTRSFPSYSSVTALQSSDPSAYYDLIDKAAKKDHTDYVPDMFNFSVDGISGSFFLDASLNPILVKKESELKIEKIISSLEGGFMITTPKGIKYTFGATESTKQRMACGTGSSNPTDFKITAWKLTQITSPTKDTITFVYDSGTQFTYQTSISEMYTDNDATAPPQEATLPSEGRTKCRYFSHVNPKILTKIYSNSGQDTIFFNSPSSREITSTKLLEDITIKNSEGKTIKEFEFNYSFILSSVNYPVADTQFGQNNTASDQKYRLFLDDIIEKDANGNSTNGKKYSFNYDDRTNMPKRLSLAQDELGYYNGANSNQSILPDFIHESSGTFYNIIKGDRDFSFTHAKKGILTKITYPTKGYTEIEYESGPSAIRVKKIKSLPKTGGVEKIVRYYYTSKENALAGTSGDTEVPFGSDDYVITKPARVSYQVSIPGEPNLTYYYDFDRTEFKSSGLFPLYSTNENKFLYSTVTVGYGDNFEGGGVEKVFRVTADQFGNAMHGERIVGASRSNTGYANGELKEERYFKKNGTAADLVKTMRYVYKEDASQEMTLDNYTGEIVYETLQNSTYGDLGVYGYNVNRIQTKARWRAIDSLITKEYFDTGTITTIQKSIYGTGLAGLPTEVTTTDSHGNVIKTKTTYIDLGANNNYVPTVIEKLNNSDPLSKVEYEYYTNYGANSLDLPKKIKTLKGVYNASTNPVEERIEFISYYDNGNVKEVEKTDGTRVVYIWGYGETKPIAKIENSTYSALITALEGTSVGDIQDASDADINGTTENTLRTYLQEIRDALPNAMVSTFTYDPLVGVTSITDPRGRTTYYYYNSYARLAYVKDHDGKIVNKTEYNYKN